PNAVQCVASFASRAWLSNGRVLSYTAPNTYNDFTGPGSGVTILTDSTLHSDIKQLLAANNFLYLIGSDSANVIGDVNIDANGETVFSNTPLSTNSIGSEFPYTIFSYYRSVLAMNRSGVYSFTGATPVKISDNLDGIFGGLNGYGAINFSFPVSGCAFM